MQFILHLTLLAISLFLIVFVWELIRYGRLRPAYALLWMVATSTFFIFIIFSGLAKEIAELFSIPYAPIVIIFLALLFTVILLLNQSVLISTLSRNNKDQAQIIAILQWRIEVLENQVKGRELET